MAAVEQQQGQERPPVTQLEFRQAMRDFKTMFPEMDEDVIEVVLRSNNGAVDATIDQLLTMSTDNENERLRTELDATENDELPPCYSPSTPPPSYHQAVPYAHSPAHSPASSVTQAANTSANSSPSVTCDPQPKQQTQLPQNVSAPQSPQIPTESLKTAEEQTLDSVTPSSPSNSGVALCTIRKWQPPLLGHLPPTFLRLDGLFPQKVVAPVENVTVLSSTMLQQRMEENERQRRSTSGTDDPELVQYLEDERIALFLQNEEFMQELRDNKEFLSTLDRASSDVSSQDEEEETEAPEELDTFPYGNSTPPTEEADAAFREKIRNMGKLSRKKFTQLARLFSRRKRRTFKPILGDGTNPSRDNLLLHEDEYSELSEEDSETEINKKDTWNSHLPKSSSRKLLLPHGFYFRYYLRYILHSDDIIAHTGR